MTVNLGSDGSDDDDEGVTTGTPQQQPAHHPMFAAGALHLHDQMLAWARQVPEEQQAQLMSQVGQAMENDLGTGATTHLTQLFQQMQQQFQP